MKRHLINGISQKWMVLLTVLLVMSCASTPERRIQKNPDLYSKLDDKDKVLVQQGRIRKGMSMSAVLLAWGGASQIEEAEVDGKSIERWSYIGTRPVAHYQPWSMGLGYGRSFGRPGWGNCGGWGWGGPFFMGDIGPSYTWVPYLSRYVEFSKGQVKNFNYESDLVLR